jgi:two-component system sensor histidine kinase YesM
VKRGKSTIQIHSSVEEEYFIIIIEDDGVGIEESKLKSLNEELSQVTSIGDITCENSSITESIGLINVNKRIKLKFGDEYGLYISSSETEGTKVILQLPLTHK